MRKRNVIIGVVAVVVVLGVWGAATGQTGSSGPRGGSFGGATSAGTPAAIPSATPVVVPTPEAVGAAPVDPAAEAPVVAEPAAPVDPAAPADPAAAAPPAADPVVEVPAAPARFRMPDLVGKDLDDVEDALEALGATDIKTTDLSGEGRSVWVSSNWKVCTQDPREGTREVKPSERIRLGVVKGSERCP